MAEPKKKPAPPGFVAGKPLSPESPADPALGDVLSREELDQFSTLQLLDLIAGKLPPRHSSLLDLVYLRERVVAMEEMNDQAREAIEKLDAIIEKLRAPAYRVGTVLAPVEPDKAHVCLGGVDYVCRCDPAIPLA